MNVLYGHLMTTAHAFIANADRGSFDGPDAYDAYVQGLTAPMDALADVAPGLAGRIASVVMGHGRVRIDETERVLLDLHVDRNLVRIFTDGSDVFVERND